MIAEKLERIIHQRYGAHFPTLSQKAYLCGCIQSNISNRKINQFLHTRSGVIEDTQQNGIPSTFRGLHVRLRKNLSQFFLVQIADHRTHVPA